MSITLGISFWRINFGEHKQSVAGTEYSDTVDISRLLLKVKLLFQEKKNSLCEICPSNNFLVTKYFINTLNRQHCNSSRNPSLKLVIYALILPKCFSIRFLFFEEISNKKFLLLFALESLLIILSLA